MHTTSSSMEGPSPSRTCAKCKHPKPLSDFRAVYGSRLTIHCLTCRSTISAEVQRSRKRDATDLTPPHARPRAPAPPASPVPSPSPSIPESAEPTPPTAPSSSSSRRHCPRCNRVQPISQFQPLKGSGLTTDCLTCRTTRNAQRRDSREALRPMHPFVPPPAPSPDGLPPMDTRPHFMRPTVASSRRATVPPAQEFRYRGIHSSDDSPHADARRQRAIIQREHRVQRRHGEQPPSTPSLTQLIQQNTVVTPSSTSSTAPPSSSLPLAQPARSPDLLPASSPPDLLPIASPEPVPAAFPTPILPAIHPSDLMSGSLERPSLTESEWELLRSFQGKLREPRMETCQRCRERWFQMGLNRDGVCRRCVRVDRNMQVFLYSHENRMQPSAVDDLPALTQVEEMLISRVHVFQEVRLVRGQQYRYRGHIVHFLRKTGRLYEQLPILPQDLDIILLRPSNTTQFHQLDRQFVADYRVRREAIARWLQFLRLRHPGYRDLQISAAALNALPHDDRVDHLLQSQDIDVDMPPEDLHTVVTESMDDNEPERVAVPDLFDEQEEITAVQNMVAPPAAPPQPYLAVPSFQETPLDEFNTRQPLLSLAFPTLFPYGEAEFLQQRERKVEYSDYIRHLIKHELGAFAQHPRFRYVAFNTILRRQAGSKAGFFVRGRDIPDLDELRAAFQEDTPEARALLRSVTTLANSLRGTGAYWSDRRRDLYAYIKNLGAAHFFLTLSAADLHWDDLMRWMPNYDDWRAADSATRIRLARANLRDNPLIAAYWFHHRYRVFQETVLDPKFGVTDYWSRYEWQGRGSTHNHGVYWVDGAPNSDELLTQAQRDTFAQFWGIHISAINPDPSRLPVAVTERPVMQYSPDERQNTLSELTDLVNRVQRHVCNERYCLRKHRVSNQLACRFHFPMALRDEPGLEKPLGSTFYRLYPVRNHPALNIYNPLVIMAWQANIDIAPCTGTKSLLQYLTKYISKGEPESPSYRHLMQTAIQGANRNRPLQSAVHKLLNRLIGNRDCSAQEVLHFLLGLPLQMASRDVIPVDLRPEALHRVTFHPRRDDGDLAQGSSKCYKYMARPPPIEDVTYLRWLRAYQHTGAQLPRRRAKDRVLRYFPIYDPDKDVEDFARVKMMLHHPFRDMQDLLSLEDNHFPTFTDAYTWCRQAHVGIHEADCYGEITVEDVPEELFEDVDLPEQTPPPQSWELLARQRPGPNPAERTEDPDALGQRDIDRQYDWTPHIGRCPDDAFPRDYWQQQRALFPATLSNTAAVEPDSLNEKQWQIYNLIVSHYLQWLKSRCLSVSVPDRVRPPSRIPDQLLINVDGKAGTGKSHVIGVISATLQAVAEDAGITRSPILRAAPTGVAAYAISGRTLHSLFRLPVPVGTTYQPLQAAQLRDVQELFQGIQYLVIDEKSMIGLRTLTWIDNRCRQIFPQHTEQLFGGLNIILAGDFFQLPPVLQKPLYDISANLTGLDLLGRQRYWSFDITIELDTVVRQQGADPQSVAFRRTLDHLRTQEVSREDWQLLSTRAAVQLDQEQVTGFDKHVHLMFHRAAVDQHNHQSVRDLRTPVIRITATNSSPAAAKASAKEASNLTQDLFLSIGCRVMLLNNTWVERGLVNGSFATIRDIVWLSTTEDVHESPPAALLVEFDAYDGPIWLQDDQRHRLVPIIPVTREFQFNGEPCSRTQFPVVLAYAITVHKAQGLTLDYAVLDISQSEFATGLRYVAVSRVRTLQGILFSTTFDLADLTRTVPSAAILARMADAFRRANQHWIDDPAPPPWAGPQSPDHPQTPSRRTPQPAPRVTPSTLLGPTSSPLQTPSHTRVLRDLAFRPSPRR
ncbi:hypothetical protein N7492_004232 [Penicillium capsulatum]|uniref:ATP-dependent DNA helicase n=1 Tax=Penicillium capsulatum TaxID=69766 RepID=A0A9W9LPU5_9EURO|nr:hypothetical protein N7492_004232 [Penicillium capsulatum]